VKTDEMLDNFVRVQEREGSGKNNRKTAQSETRGMREHNQNQKRVLVEKQNHEKRRGADDNQDQEKPSRQNDESDKTNS